MLNSFKLKFFVDIMLVKLRRPSDVTPQQMNFDPSFPADGIEATVIGFGATVEGGSSSFTLQQVAIPIVSFDACDGFWNKLDKATQVCTGTNMLYPTSTLLFFPTSSNLSLYFYRSTRRFKRYLSG